MPTPTTALVERYLTAIADPTVPVEEVAAMLHPEIVYIERPNMFSPGGSRRDRDEMLSSLERGRALIVGQQFEVRDHHAVDDTLVVTRARWQGETATALGPLPAGTRFRSDTAMFFEFRDGLIFRQENFDCFALPEAPDA